MGARHSILPSTTYKIKRKTIPNYHDIYPTGTKHLTPSARNPTQIFANRHTLLR